MSAGLWWDELQPRISWPHQIKDITNLKKKQPGNSQNLRPLCTPHVGRSFFSLWIRAICIFILRTRDPKWRTWTQWWGCRYREPISVSCHWFLLCWTLTEGTVPAACSARPACPWLPAGPQHHCCLIPSRNHPLTPFSSTQEIVSRLFHSSAHTRYPKYPSHFLFLLFLFPTRGAMP